MDIAPTKVSSTLTDLQINRARKLDDNLANEITGVDGYRDTIRHDIRPQWQFQPYTSLTVSMYPLATVFVACFCEVVTMAASLPVDLSATICFDLPFTERQCCCCC